MDLQESLSRWDGKSAEQIEAVYVRYQLEPRFINQVVTFIISGQNSIGATWLLKHYLELRGSLPPRLRQKIYDALPRLESWQSRLHILQSLPFIPVSATCKKQVEIFLRKGLTDNNKMVRAWSYNGLYELSRQFPELQPEIRQIFAMAIEDEAPSVKARIRNIMKSDSKNKIIHNL